jgi:hypothetical protein
VRDNGCKCMQESEYVRFFQKEKGYCAIKGRKGEGKRWEREGGREEKKNTRNISDELLAVRQSDSQTVRQSDSQTVRQSDSQTVRQSDRQTCPQAHINTHIQTDREKR